jgi:6-phosphogluconolactonase (cycloisomerase 2 family)
MQSKWINVAGMLGGMAMLAAAVAGCNGSSIQSSGGPTPVPKPGPQFLYCSNNEDSQVSEFLIDAKTGALGFEEMVFANGSTTPSPGAAGMAATPKSSVLYVANQKTAQIFGFLINAKNGNLKPTAQGNVSTGAGTEPTTMAMNPIGGPFLYVVDQANDQIFQFAAGQGTGELTPLSPPTVSTKPSAGAPFQKSVSITFSPTGNAVFVANQNSGLIIVFGVNKNGTLTPTGTTDSLGAGNPGKPTWVQADQSSAQVLYVADDLTTAPGGPGGQVSVFSTFGAAITKFLGAFSTGNTTGVPLSVALNSNLSFVYTGNDGANTVSDYRVNSMGLDTPLVLTGFTGVTNVTTDATGSFFYGASPTLGQIFQGLISNTDGSIKAIGSGAVNTEVPANPGSNPFQLLPVETPALAGGA